MKKKDSSQRGLGSYVPAHLNESPFYEDSISQKGREYGTLEPSKKKAAVNMLYKGLNNAESGKRGNVAFTVADYIIENAVVESDSDNSAEVYRNTVELLKPYLHTLKLDSIKAEIKHRFDKAEILTECLGYCVLKHSFTLFI